MNSFKEIINEHFEEFILKIKTILVIDSIKLILDKLKKIEELNIIIKNNKKCDCVIININISDNISENSYIDEIINNYGLAGKLVFLNKFHSSINCVYYDNYDTLVQKIYYMGINYNIINNILKNSIDFYINNVLRTEVIVYVPIWGRHSLLEKCIKSIYNQTYKVTIIGLCSTIEDYKFIQTLSFNVVPFITFNAPLGNKYQFGIEVCKFFYPKNCIIMGSDDIMTPNYIENINKYTDKYDVIGLKNWMIYILNKNELYNIQYNYKKKYTKYGKIWGYKYNCNKIFNTPEIVFTEKKFKNAPFTIGSGRSIGYKILNTIGWQVYQPLPCMLDTCSLFKLLVLNNAKNVCIYSKYYCIISIKDLTIDMITSWNKYINSQYIIIKKNKLTYQLKKILL